MADPAPAVAARLPWGVAALLVATGDTLAARFGSVSVHGELSGFSRAASGHCYFSLKDAAGAAAVLRLLPAPSLLSRFVRQERPVVGPTVVASRA